LRAPIACAKISIRLDYTYISLLDLIHARADYIDLRRAEAFGMDA